MNDQLRRTDGVLRNLSCMEKRRHSTVLSDVVWDIEANWHGRRERGPN
jgi:hypothetical protein